MCKEVRCKYGEDCLRQYEEGVNAETIRYEMLASLGIENCYSITLEQVKEIAYMLVDNGIHLSDFINMKYKEYASDEAT